MKYLKLWLFDIARGYSLPMSFFNFLPLFVYLLNDEGNFFFGLLAFVAIIFAQAGVNMYDTVIDYSGGIPQKDIKVSFLIEGKINLRDLKTAVLLVFGISALIGLFFFLKFSFPVLFISGIAGIICLLYPKLNNYTLGELAIFLMFGPLLAAGLSTVMTGEINFDCILISVSSGILTAVVALVHSFTDFDDDKKIGKNTLCVRAGSRENSVKLIAGIIIFAFFFDLILIILDVLPKEAVIALCSYAYGAKITENLRNSLTNPEDYDFLKIFMTAQNLFLIHSVLLSAVMIF